MIIDGDDDKYVNAENKVFYDCDDKNNTHLEMTHKYHSFECIVSD